MVSTPHPFRVAIFASGKGTNAENISKYFASHPSIRVVALFSNQAEAYALVRARMLNIEAYTFTRQEFQQGVVLNQLTTLSVTHIVLAGFLWLIPKHILQAYPDRIINIHPALLPKYGGLGMFGLRVHEAVREAGEKETGITIHLVNENYDEGRVLFQQRCEIGEELTAQQIAQCVQALEYEHYPKVIEKWILESTGHH